MTIFDVNTAQREIEQLRALALGLAQQWEMRARRKFTDAADEEDAQGKRMIEHGAVCYFNAAAETRSAFGLPELTPNGKDHLMTDSEAGGKSCAS